MALLDAPVEPSELDFRVLYYARLASNPCLVSDLDDSDPQKDQPILHEPQNTGGYELSSNLKWACEEGLTSLIGLEQL